MTSEVCDEITYSCPFQPQYQQAYEIFITHASTFSSCLELSNKTLVWGLLVPCALQWMLVFLSKHCHKLRNTTIYTLCWDCTFDNWLVAAFGDIVLVSLASPSHLPEQYGFSIGLCDTHLKKISQDGPQIHKCTSEISSTSLKHTWLVFAS